MLFSRVACDRRRPAVAWPFPDLMALVGGRRCVELRWPDLVDFAVVSGSVFCHTQGEEPPWWRCIIQRLEDLPVGIVLSQRRLDVLAEGQARVAERAVEGDWEQEARDTADVVVVGVEEDRYWASSLIELGRLCANSPNKVVCLCPDGFIGRVDVEVAAELHGITLVRDTPSLAVEVRRRLEEVNRLVDPGCVVS